MNAELIVGVGLIAAVFVGIFLVLARELGWGTALGMFAFSTALTAVITTGAFLIERGTR